MKKIPTMFQRNPDNMREIINEYHPACEWVADNEGTATRKYDGTCCAIIDGKFYKRRQVKPGQSMPDDFIEVDRDANTDKIFGWVLVSDAGKEDKPYREAFNMFADEFDCVADETFELLGPKVQGNPEKQLSHILQSHLHAETYGDVPRTFNALKEWLASKDIEGLVFQHSDGRMAKIKKRDFGQKR